MTASERRASLSLAGIFALRMLGLFLVLPVFALEAAHYPGGDDPALVGLALGAYGLAQAALQMPLGMASDRWGRKRVILAGLLVFAVGCAAAALANSVQTLALARGLQGAGAISAAVTALLADLTRDEVRTKAMMMVGISIGLTFALSLMIAPPLTAALGGLPGLFWLTAALALASMGVVARVTPAEPPRPPGATRGRLADVWRHPHLWRLDAGVFVLHAVQMAMWVVVPGLLVQAGLPKPLHWQLYVPAVLAAFVLTGGVMALERRGHVRGVLRGGIGLLLAVQLLLLALAPRLPGLWALGLGLALFFLAFNTLEIIQPSLLSRLAPPASRGAALGQYNTLQSLGLFAGGALGGLLLKHGGVAAVFSATTALAALWLWLGWAQPVPAPAPRAAPQE